AVSADMSPRPGKTASTPSTPCAVSFGETLSSPPATPLSRTCSQARTLAEHYDLYLDNLQACQNHPHPVD
ncbi:MAG: hypothetical protein WA124_09405, partial [Smithella sp.]